MLAKQAINDKLQGSVVTYLRCSGAVNNQIRKDLLLSMSVIFFKIGEYLATFQALSSSFSSSVGQARKVHETTTLLLVSQIFTDFKKNFQPHPVGFLRSI